MKLIRMKRLVNRWYSNEMLHHHLFIERKYVTAWPSKYHLYLLGRIGKHITVWVTLICKYVFSQFWRYSLCYLNLRAVVGSRGLLTYLTMWLGRLNKNRAFNTRKTKKGRVTILSKFAKSVVFLRYTKIYENWWAKLSFRKMFELGSKYKVHKYSLLRLSSVPIWWSNLA